MVCLTGGQVANDESNDKNKARNALLIDRALRMLGLSLVVLGAYKFFIYGSVLNKMRFFKTWDGSDDIPADGLTIGQFALSLFIDICNPTSFAASL